MGLAFIRNLAFAREMIAQRRRDDPHLSEEELAHFGRIVFARLAMDAEDGPEWARQQFVRQREIRLELEVARVKLARQKFEFDAAAACLKHFAAVKVIVNSSGLTEPQKIERVCQAMREDPKKPQASTPSLQGKYEISPKPSREFREALHCRGAPVPGPSNVDTPRKSEYPNRVWTTALAAAEDGRIPGAVSGCNSDSTTCSGPVPRLFQTRSWNGFDWL